METVARCLLIATSVGCVSAGNAEHAVRSDRSVLTAEHFEGQQFQTAYDAVASLRSNWLLTRGPMSFSTDSSSRIVVWVYLDNVKMGDTETLKNIPMRQVRSITHLDGVEAQARYGTGHVAGVILVDTWVGPRPGSGLRRVIGDGR